MVDVPKEFQNIIDSLSSLVLSNVHDSRVEVGFPGNDSVESSIVSIGPVIESSMDSEVKVNNNNNSNGIASGHGKSASQTIVYKGVGYHMVNWLVICTTWIFIFVITFFKAIKFH